MPLATYAIPFCSLLCTYPSTHGGWIPFLTTGLFTARCTRGKETDTYGWCLDYIAVDQMILFSSAAKWFPLLFIILSPISHFWMHSSHLSSLSHATIVLSPTSSFAPLALYRLPSCTFSRLLPPLLHLTLVIVGFVGGINNPLLRLLCCSFSSRKHDAICFSHVVQILSNGTHQTSFQWSYDCSYPVACKISHLINSVY